MLWRRYAGGVAEYRSSEGKCVEVDYRGPVEATVLDLLGGLRSACTYTGAAELKEMSKRNTELEQQKIKLPEGRNRNDADDAEIEESS